MSDLLDLAQVRSFVAVVDTGNFREAARKLGLAQPTVSQHVRKLEETLGLALLIRNNAGCRPLPKGEMFLPRARRLLRAEQEARQSIGVDRLVVGAASNLGIYLMPRAISAFQESTKRVSATKPTAVDLSIGSNPDIIEQLRLGDVDIAVTEWWNGLDGFTAHVWRREPMVVIVAPGHPFANRASVTISELIGERFIGGERGTGTGRLLAQCFGKDAATSLQIVAELGSTEAVKNAVIAGFGISIVLAATVEKEIASGLLRGPVLEGPAFAKDLFIAMPLDMPDASAARRFKASLEVFSSGASSACNQVTP